MAEETEKSKPSSQAIIDVFQPFNTYKPGLIQKFVWFLCSWQAVANYLEHKFPGPFDVIVSTLKLRLYPADSPYERALLMGGKLPEHRELQLIRPMLESGTNFVDIHAGPGIYSIFASQRIGSTGKVVAVEPHPGLARKLNFNLEINQCGNVKHCPFAINTDDGHSEFLDLDQQASGGTTPIKHYVDETGNRVNVAGRKLEYILKDERLEKIDVLKIDLAGEEDLALLPFFRTASVSLFPRTILLNIARRNLWRDNLIQVLNQLGYRETGSTGQYICLTRQQSPG